MENYGLYPLSVVEAIRELYSKLSAVLVTLAAHDSEIALLKTENAKLRAVLCEISPQTRICLNKK